MRWFLQRFLSMNIQELSYRIGQQFSYQLNRKYKGLRLSNKSCSLKNRILPISYSLIEYTTTFQIFDKVINTDTLTNWHFDISTNKVFSLHYSREIDIRSGRSGSAKYVWEVNRMQFLPNLCLAFKQSNDLSRLERFITINQSWINDNPYLVGVNWYSNIEVNLRLINWFLCWNLLDGSELIKQVVDFKAFVTAQWIPSIYQHCVYSYQNPSFYSSANNHLISEYAGLFIASSFWQFEESPKWQQYAKKGLEKEIVLQHRKGVNREEAAEYIQFITDFFLLAYLVGERTDNPFSETYSSTLKEIFYYIANFLDCKGNFPKYGDEDDGRVYILGNEDEPSNFLSLLTSGAVLFNDEFLKSKSVGWDLKNQILFGEEGKLKFDAIPIKTQLSDSVIYPQEGHFIFRKQEDIHREIYLHFDSAPLGYLSIAAHGHADALSFVLHLDGFPFIVDPGTYTYHTDPDWRKYFVSTKAHNTVTIDGKNQALHVGGLLWAQHYHCQVADWQSDALLDFVSAHHDGYDKMGCRHQRNLKFDKQKDSIVIEDVILNKNRQTRTVEVCFHLHPQVQLKQMDTNEFVLSHAGTHRTILLRVDSQLECRLFRGEENPISGWYSPSFQRKMPAWSLIGTLHTKNEKITLSHQILINEQ